jgi:hypothetical protein
MKRAQRFQSINLLENQLVIKKIIVQERIVGLLKEGGRFQMLENHFVGTCMVEERIQ